MAAMTTWETTWRHPKNAVAFAAEIADLAIARHRKALVDEVEDIVVGKLRVSRSGLLAEDPDVFDKEDRQYRLFRERYRTTSPVRSVFTLVDFVGTLWDRPERRLRRIYSYSQQAGLDLFDVSRIELAHRLRDQDPNGRLNENHRLAFEAAWLAGRPDFAVQLVQRTLRDARPQPPPLRKRTSHKRQT